jgi:hypothetical protein
VLGAEQLAADRTGEDILAGVGAEKRGEDAEGAARFERDGGVSLWAIGGYGL